MEADRICSPKHVFVSPYPLRAYHTTGVSDFDIDFLSDWSTWYLLYRSGKAPILRLKITCLAVVLRLANGGKDNNLGLDLGEQLQDALDRMSSVFRLVIMQLRKGGKEERAVRKEERAVRKEERALSSNVAELDLLNPDIQLVYAMISSKFSSTGCAVTRTILESFLENLDFFVSNIVDMMTFSKDFPEDLEAAQPCLTFLRDFLRYTSKRCTEIEKLKDLVNHAQFVVGNLSCLLYLGSAHTDVMISDVLKKFSPAQPEVRDTYIKALKGHSAPVLVDTVDMDFLVSLRDYILEHPGIKLSYSMGSEKDHHQMLNMYLQQELLFLLISYLVYKSSEAHEYSTTGIFLHMEPKPDQIYNYFLKHISSAIADMGSRAFSLLHHSEQSTDKAEELNVAFSDLQDFIKNAKKEAINAYAAYIPKSWRLKTKFSLIDEETMKHFLTKKIESISQGSREFRPIPRHLCLAYEKELQSLTEAFEEYLITKKQQHLDHGKQEIDQMIMTCINQIRCHEFFRLNAEWEKLWFLHLIEQIKMVKMEFKDFQNQMMQCVGSNSQGKTEGIHDCAAIFENEAQLPTTAGAHEIDEVKVLIFKARSLNVFLNCKGMWDLEDGNLKLLLTHIQSVFQSVEQDLQRLFPDLNIQSSLDINVQGFPMNVDCPSSKVLLSRFQHLETDIQAVHSIITKSSTRFITSISDEGLVEYLNIVLKNVDVLQKCIIELPSLLKEQLEDVVKSLRFLRNFLGFTGKRCSSLGILKDLLNLSEQLVANVSSLLYLCFESEKVNDPRMNEIKVLSSFELWKFCSTQVDTREIYVKALKASMSAKENSDSVVQVLDEYILGFLDSLCDHILELSHNNSNFIASVKEEILSLLEEMKFIITFFPMGRSLDEHRKHDQMSNSLFEDMNVVIIDLGCLIFLLNDSGSNEEMAQELNRKVSDLGAKIVAIKVDIRKIYDLYFPKQFQCDFPRTNGQGFLGSLFKKLNELLNAKPNSIAPIMHHIEIVQKELLSLGENFSEIAKQPERCDDIEAQWILFLDIAYEIELTIDSFLVGGNPVCCHLLGFFKVIEEAKKIKAELKAVKIKLADENPMQKSSEFSVKSYSPKSNFVLSSKEELANERSMTKSVILREEAGKILEQLLSTSPKLIIISIVGMPGIGKTTLADKVFQDSQVVDHFRIRARCCVSQVPDKRRLLLEILQKVNTESIQDSDYGDLLKKLYQNLKGKRYLILMDDLWDIQLWREMSSSFPDDEIGSRIIFTSRFQEISEQTGLENRNYCLSRLSKEKSWEMLKLKLFGNKSPRAEHEKFGREIAAKCKGLPLTIDLVSGILRVKETNEWNKVAENLTALVLDDPQGRCRKVLELSYQNLPDDMKACFLYFSAFPEDTNVLTRDLILFWIAEGFVQPGKDVEFKSIEDAAEDILNNLITRSLVTVSSRGHLGGVSKSRVHDLLHEFAVAKAKEERFMEKIVVKEGWGELNGGKSYRMCINPLDWERFIELNPSGFRTRALIFTTLKLDPRKFNCDSFKLLKILYIPSIGSTQVFKLIHLRVLTIGLVGKLEKFKFVSKIHKLHNLESFRIVGPSIFFSDSPPYLFLLLDKICNMVRLRHLDFGDYICFRYRSEKIWEMSSLLNNLQSLRKVKFSDGEDVGSILKLMPNLVSLEVQFYICESGCYLFPKLDFLEKLETLNVSNYCLTPVIGHLPKNLKRLVLSNFEWHWTEISEIGNLEHLEVLELYSAFKGPIWEMIDGQFPKLKYLILSDMELEEWNAEAENLSCLQKLSLINLRSLKMLPSCLGEIATLEAITLIGCSVSAKDSAKRIKKEQEEAGNELFKLSQWWQFIRT